MTFEKAFERDYREWFHEFSNKRLMQIERNLSAVIDSDLFDDFILNDEVVLLYEIIRDECVLRVEKMAEIDSSFETCHACPCEP